MEFQFLFLTSAARPTPNVHRVAAGLKAAALPDTFAKARIFFSTAN
jgi:hypothetical protein